MWVLSLVPPAAFILFTMMCMIPGLHGDFLRGMTPVAAVLAVGAVLMLGRKGPASPVHKTMAGFLVLAAFAVLLSPAAAGVFVTSYPTPCLYVVLFLMAAGPAVLGREVFTVWFAKRKTPEALWHTEAFAVINRNMTWHWAGIFVLCMVSGFSPALLGIRGAAFIKTLFQGVIPVAILIGVGIPLNRYYPAYYQRRFAPWLLENEAPENDEKNQLPMQENLDIGLKESEIKTEKDAGARGPGSAKSCRELLRMMPHGFSPAAANGLRAVYQFEVSGGEAFTAHLRIDPESCTYLDGPADRPDVVIKTPADVWLAVSKGEMNGQTAFMSGMYKVEGDMGLLLRLRTLFPG